MMRIFLICLFFVLLFDACNQKEDSHKNETSNRDRINVVEKWIEPDTIIIDSKLSFEEAIEGSNAPQAVIDELELIDVTYISTDEKLHQGQILTNKKLVPDLRELFQFMLEQDFVIERAIPIIAYDWSDSLSMADNNSYSFCYRNITYSYHAKGLAIDINPRFNPLRWKNKDLPNEPIGAVLDTTVNGTLYPNHPVVKEFRKRGFRWGHTFSKYWDDHHFEKR
ncbi:MAG TPA: M15 family metallopeptidase [Dysgonamonadaceae bacterium]|nr:M15 family metallopeptidase [Dysgonamonadaceae bacterium]